MRFLVFLSLFLVMVLCGCSPDASIHDFQKVKAGMTEDEVKKIMSVDADGHMYLDKTPLYFSYRINGEYWTIEFQNGIVAEKHKREGPLF